MGTMCRASDKQTVKLLTSEAKSGYICQDEYTLYTKSIKCEFFSNATRIKSGYSAVGSGRDITNPFELLTKTPSINHSKMDDQKMFDSTISPTI